MPRRRGPRTGGPPFKRGPARKLPLPSRFAGPAASVGSVIPLSLGMEGDSALGASLIATRVLASSVVGDGYVASSPLGAVRPIGSGLVGDGYLASAPLSATRILSLGIVGDGYLTPALVATRSIAASVAGSGALNGVVGALRLLTLSANGGGALANPLVAVRPLALASNGTGVLAAQISPPSMSAGIGGGGILNVALVPVVAAPSGENQADALPPSPVMFSRKPKQSRDPRVRRETRVLELGLQLHGRMNVTMTIVARRSVIQEQIAIALLEAVAA